MQIRSARLMQISILIGTLVVRAAYVSVLVPFSPPGSLRHTQKGLYIEPCLIPHMLLDALLLRLLVWA